MYKLINKIGKFGLCLLLLSTIVACGSNIEENETIDHKTIEMANIQEDYILFSEIQEVYNNNNKKTTTDEQKCVVMLKYLDDVYQLTSNRFNLDADILTSFSDEYIEYIGLCHVYATTYLEDRADLLKDVNIKSQDYTLKKTETGVLLDLLDDTYATLSKTYGISLGGE